MILSSAFILAAALSAQTQAQVAQQWEIGVVAGGGPSVVTGSLGGVRDRQLLIGSLYLTRPIVRWKPLALSYFAEATPLVVLTGVPKLEGRWYFNLARSDSMYFIRQVGGGPVLGGGVAPVGFRLSAQVTSSILAYTEASGGIATFFRAVPIPDARALNFQASAGAGVRVGKRAHRTYLLGYRFTHLSNANTAPKNPGFNAHVVYLGLTIH